MKIHGISQTIRYNNPCNCPLCAAMDYPVRHVLHMKIIIPTVSKTSHELTSWQMIHLGHWYQWTRLQSALLLLWFFTSMLRSECLIPKISECLLRLLTRGLAKKTDTHHGHVHLSWHQNAREVRCDPVWSITEHWGLGASGIAAMLWWLLWCRGSTVVMIY